MTPYIDLHCDTLMQAYLKGVPHAYHLPDAMLDVRRLRGAGCMAEFFAIFMPPEGYAAEIGVEIPDDETYIAALRRIMLETAAAHGDEVALAGNGQDLRANAAQGKLSAFLTLEDGRAVNGSMENLERFYEMGIRLISLTWNGANCFGAPNSTDPAAMEQGLTAFGKDAVARMNELGMLVDVSHLSDGGFRDVAALSKKPFVASHSNCRALSPHPRNLTDGMIRTLADSGGVMGLNFAPQFLRADTALGKSAVADMVRHLQHMKQVGGADCIAIGTDLDGISGDLEIGEPSRMHLLFEGLGKAGFTAGEIEKIAYQNARRVIEETM